MLSCNGSTNMMDRQTDRQTDTQTDTHRHTDRQTDRQTDTQTHRQRQTDTQTHRQRQTDRQTILLSNFHVWPSSLSDTDKHFVSYRTDTITRSHQTELT